MRFDRRTRASALGAVLLLLAACGSDSGGDPPAPSPSLSVVPRPASTAELQVLSPTNGEVVKAGNVPMRVALTGAELVPSASTDLQPDEGHLHVLLDDQLLDMTSDLRGTLTDVSPGDHLLRIEFVASDHAPFDPRVVADVTFTAK
ncbi:MAG: hypothetical protein WEA10_01475 [Actinomycetota bacterium]